MFTKTELLNDTSCIAKYDLFVMIIAAFLEVERNEGHAMGKPRNEPTFERSGSWTKAKSTELDDKKLTRLSLAAEHLLRLIWINLTEESCEIHVA